MSAKNTFNQSEIFRTYPNKLGEIETRPELSAPNMRCRRTSEIQAQRSKWQYAIIERIFWSQPQCRRTADRLAQER